MGGRFEACDCLLRMRLMQSTHQKKQNKTLTQITCLSITLEKAGMQHSGSDANRKDISSAERDGPFLEQNSHQTFVIVLMNTILRNKERNTINRGAQTEEPFVCLRLRNMKGRFSTCAGVCCRASSFSLNKPKCHQVKHIK